MVNIFGFFLRNVELKISLVDYYYKGTSSEVAHLFDRVKSTFLAQTVRVSFFSCFGVRSKNGPISKAR
jgi:hypothetical protein